MCTFVYVHVRDFEKSRVRKNVVCMQGEIGAILCETLSSHSHAVLSYANGLRLSTPFAYELSS